MHIVESGEITQSFFSNWMPNKDQSTIVINTNEIARKFEAAYGIKSGSIRINTIMINNCGKNVDNRRRRRQLDTKKSEMCDRLGSDCSITEIAMNIIYPARCAISMSCKKEFADVIQARIAAYISNILVEFKFADGSFSELELTRCKKVTDSPLNSLLRLRRSPQSTTAKATTAKVTAPTATIAKATTAKATAPTATTAKAIAPTATTAKATTAKVNAPTATTAKAVTTSGKQLYVS
ncbi:unnamed protein product [Rotaria sordida]|uniref:Uncharacterized protein n=1 Tax=Rotaria sordida TaxID=392033 RepID=A0A819UZ01_9BILA|nr:unnamed protein product [Rotaria sordida]